MSLAAKSIRKFQYNSMAMAKALRSVSYLFFFPRADTEF
jgi:hypothetical protein